MATTDPKNALATTESQTLSEYMRRADIVQRFAEVLGSDREASKYIQSVLIEVAASTNGLQECTPRSIYRAALDAASLGLMCNRSAKQAYLVPYNRKIKTKDARGAIVEQYVKEANFQPHYMGLYTLAMRTGKYRFINVRKIYQGMEVMEDFFTGLHSVKLANGLIADPNNSAAALVGARNAENIPHIGYLGYMETTRGQKKTIYITVEEIHEHARKYASKAYADQNGQWKTNTDLMEWKTAMRALLKFADMSGTEGAKLQQALEASDDTDRDSIDAEVTAAAETAQTATPEPAPVPTRTLDENLERMGFGG